MNEMEIGYIVAKTVEHLRDKLVLKDNKSLDMSTFAWLVRRIKLDYQEDIKNDYK